MSFIRINKVQAQIISAVTFGNILEWFEIYLFVYWAPTLSRVFFVFDSDLVSLISIFIIFGVGFIARPLGAMFFGHLGDMIGRKRAFTLSITVMTIPTFLMGLLPTYAQVGVFAPILLGILRFLQSFPSAGESPGAFCYLYENADASNQKFMTSWGGFGNQLGAILSIVESIFMEKFLSPDFLMSWGWRISFFSGGLIGLFGIYLRYTLHETPLFIKLQEHHQVLKETVFDTVRKYKKNIAIGVAYGVVNAATFYLIVSYIPNYFLKSLKINQEQDIYITLTALVLTTILLPFFGALGDKVNCRSILLVCVMSIIGLLLPLCFFVENMNYYGIAAIGFLYILPVTCITALVPYLLTDLFPTSVRFTCVGLSFNLADGIVGGFTPAIVLGLTQITGSQTVFCWFILLCSLISLVSYYKIKH